MTWPEQPALSAFADDRDWHRYHSQKNLALAICSEAGELAHLYRWSDVADPAQAADEVADVLIFALCLCNRLEVDAAEIVRAKIAQNEERFPVA